jgi:hypothetical protein
MTSFGSNTELRCNTYHGASFEELYKAILKKNITYNIVITGTVAAGKSLRCDLIKELMLAADEKHQQKHTNIYPEYITHSDIGDLMLKRCQDGLITMTTFQNYIIDEWANILSQRPLANINIFERCPEDGAKIFCVALDNVEKSCITHRLNKLAARFHIPTFNNKCFLFNEIISDDPIKNIGEMISIMRKDVEEAKDNTIINRIFGLRISTEESYNRLKLRARKAEDALNYSCMKQYVDSYDTLYKELMNNRAKTVSDLV